MSDAEIRPGWWFSTERSEVLAVKDYHDRHLPGDVMVKAPPLPALDSASRAMLDKRMRAWHAKVKKVRMPAPPRKGSVIAHVPKLIRDADTEVEGRPGLYTWKAETHFYQVAARSRKALDLLRRLADAAGGMRRGKLEWVPEKYWWTSRPDRTSLAEGFRNRAPIVEAEAEFDRATAVLRSAKAKGASKRAIANHESWRAASRKKLASARREAAERSSGEDELAVFCLEVAEKESVQEIAAEFVNKYGPLILDFGAWCHDTEYGSFASRHPATALDYAAPVRLLANERFIWPRRWRRWATELFVTAGRFVEPPPKVPPPVGFYVWAAYMLTALRDHPEWRGCQLFLANRLASLRLVSDVTWFPALAKHFTSHQGRRLAARLHGELLDYLALAAAYRSGPRSIERIVLCQRCGVLFPAADGRRRYCDSCSKPKVRNAVRAQRYRDRKGNQKTQ